MSLIGTIEVTELAIGSDLTGFAPPRGTFDSPYFLEFLRSLILRASV